MDIYTRREIARVLEGLGAADQAAKRANHDYPEEYNYLAGHHDGFQAALVAVGLAFGLGPMVRPWQSDGPIWIEGSTNE